MLAAGGAIDFGAVFRDLAIILVVAKLAAELFERIRVPAVLGEIVAGILIGPSVLGLVDPTDTLKVLAEIGVIVLLANVGMETDLNELRRVGRASMIVAIIGVVVPMAVGIGAGSILGESGNASLFLGAALAATSVGITARVFGDLHALASTEARIVLGAAVADDVLGLIILTVVTRVVEQGSVDVAGVASTIGLAVGFLVVALAVGIVVVPRVMRMVGRVSTSGATIGVIGAAITFAFSTAASTANLAPIIGAFVAGTALGRSPHHERVERELASLGSIFIPVFFLQIGIDTDVTKFFQSHVLWVALILTLVAIGGKLVSGFGAVGTNTDRLLIGIGMVPRGEVGLIFATIGVSVGVFHDDLYAVVLLVVLVTTMVTPPLLRWRIERGGSPSVVVPSGGTTDRPRDGWITTESGKVAFRETPSAALTLNVALDVALESATTPPDPDLMSWFHEMRAVPLLWTADATDAFVRLLRDGNSRSWRFLEITGILERALPHVARAFAARRSDSMELDPTAVTRLATVEAIKTRFANVDQNDPGLLLAAFVADLELNTLAAEETIGALVLPEETQHEVVSLLSASTLLCATVTSEPYVHSPRVMSQLAEYLRSPLAVEKCRILSEARREFSDWQYSLLLEVNTGIQALLAHPELLDGQQGSLEDVNRRDALAMTNDPLARDRITHAASSYIVSHDPATIVRHAQLVEPAPRGRTVRVNVEEGPDENTWEIDIAARDARGLLARITSVLAERGLDIITADLATWPDGAIVDTFIVRSTMRPNPSVIAFEIEQSLRRRVALPRRLQLGASHGLALTLDNEAHPWHSTVIVSGTDQPGLLQAVAAAFARANVSVHHARIYTDGGVVTDRFEVSDRHGRKITRERMARVESLLS